MPNLKPYPAYKPAAVPWLQQVPAQWEFKRAKSVFFGVDVKSKTGKEELLTVSSANGIVKRRESNVNMFKAKTYVGHKLCWPEDLVINSLWAWGRGLGFSREHGIISTAYGVYRLREQQKHLWQYLDYTLRSSTYQWELQVRSKGVWKSRLQLTDASFFDMPILMPPKEDADLIVRYLHALDAKVKRYIRTKRKLIAALQEQKQAIIQRAVTRGLDPNVKLKPSGVEWLGEVPEHWEVTKLRYLTKQIVDGTHFTPTYKDEGVAFLRVTDIHKQVVDQARLRRISSTEHAILNKRCNPEIGDLLLSKNGTIGLTKVVDWDFPFSIFVSLCLIKPIRKLINPYFIAFAFEGGLLDKQVSEITKTTSVTNLHLDKIRGLIIPVPPLLEQSQIITETRILTDPIVTTLSRILQEIQLMQEYHTRLVADVVTGVVDVTTAAKAMAVETDEVMEEEPLSMAADGEAEYEESEE